MIGVKIVCINVDPNIDLIDITSGTTLPIRKVYAPPFLTLNKTYEIVEPPTRTPHFGDAVGNDATSFYYVINDRGTISNFRVDRFRLLSDIREEKLNTLIG